MRNRREFIKTVAGAAGALVMGNELVSFAAAQAPQAAAPPVSRVGKIMVGGKRVKVVDVHCHWNIAGTPSLNPGGGGRGGRGGGAAAGGGWRRWRGGRAGGGRR